MGRRHRATPPVMLALEDVEAGAEPADESCCPDAASEGESGKAGRGG